MASRTTKQHRDEATATGEMQRLRAAFESFGETSAQMRAAYQALAQRVKRVDAQLARTNRELAEKVAELDRTTRHLDHLLQSMHSGVIAIDRTGCVRTFNRAACDILGLAREEAVGRAYDKLFPSWADEGKGLMRALSPEQAPLVEEREVFTEGQPPRQIESSLSPTLNGDGRLCGAVEVFRDVTELKRLREKVHRADKLAALGQMAAKLAHEIRNPLNGIEGFASLLERDLEPKDQRRRFAQNIVRGVRDLNRVVADMLGYVQDRPLRARPTPIRRVIEQALMFVAEDIRHRGASGVRITQQATEELLVMADPDQLQRAVLNLVVNAVDAVQGRGRIELSVRRDPSGGPRPVVLKISDTGSGVDEKDLAHLFEPFFTTKPSGTGIGLAVTRQIIERHGGTITVHSRREHGTTFCICLPEAPCEQAHGPAAEHRTEPRVAAASFREAGHAAVTQQI